MNIFKKIFNPNVDPDPQPSKQDDTAAPSPEEAIDAGVGDTPAEEPAIADTEVHATDNSALGDHVQVAHATLVNWIIDALAPLRGGLDDAEVLDMTIHVDDARTRLLMGDTFLKKVRLALDNNMLSPLAAGEITVDDTMPAAPNAIVAGGGRLLLVLASRRHVVREEPTATGRAVITVVEGTGSLAEPSYLLDAALSQVYRIGRGRVARQRAAIRVNDIVINDLETDERLLAMNMQVSSQHADVLCHGGAFYLRATVSGCRAEGGAKTMVFHGQQGKELRDTFTEEPLHDGDIIALGGSLLLNFKVVD